jgi:hypothetical protein
MKHHEGIEKPQFQRSVYHYSFHKGKRNPFKKPGFQGMEIPVFIDIKLHDPDIVCYDRGVYGKSPIGNVLHPIRKDDAPQMGPANKIFPNADPELNTRGFR